MILSSSGFTMECQSMLRSAQKLEVARQARENCITNYSRFSFLLLLTALFGPHLHNITIRLVPKSSPSTMKHDSRRKQGMDSMCLTHDPLVMGEPPPQQISLLAWTRPYSNKIWIKGLCFFSSSCFTPWSDFCIIRFKRYTSMKPFMLSHCDAGRNKVGQIIAYIFPGKAIPFPSQQCSITNTNFSFS